jgi:hypothetical protein
LIANQIRKKLLPNISDYYSLIVDETSDISNKEQVSICLRWVDNNLMIREHFIGFYDTPSTTGEALFELVKNVLKGLNLNPSKMVGKAFDGAASMSGQFKGLSARLSSISPLAIYVHCYAHRLNLAVESSCNQIKDVRDIISIVQALYVFIEGSPKRHAQFESINENDSFLTLKKLCATRWACRHEAFKALCLSFSTVIKFLKVI